MNLFKNIKSAVKSVILNFKEYIWLYAALFVVQCIFGVYLFSAFTSNIANDRLFDSAYDYDVKLSGSASDIIKLEKSIEQYTFRDTDTGISTYYEKDGELYVSLNKGGYDLFCASYNLENLKQEFSPGYIYDRDVKSELSIYSIVFGAVVFLINVLILTAVYSIRINNYKFLYGLYAAFGADKRRLYEAALSEMLAIFTVIFLPSCIVSYLISLAIYHWQGVVPVIDLLCMILLLVLGLLTVCISVALPVIRISGRTVSNLLSSKDNADLVSSPGSSFDFFLKNKFPFDYERASFIRFRKYYAFLTLYAVCFCALFMSGLYVGDMISSIENTPVADLKMVYSFYDGEDKANSYTDAEDIMEDLLLTDGVDSIRWERSLDMSGNTMDHLLLKSSAVVKNYKDNVDCKDEWQGYSVATNRAKYVLIDELTMKMYESIYNVEYADGYDATNISEGEYVIVVSENLYGDQYYSFKPGDKIIIARQYGKVNSDDFKSATSNAKLLKAQIEKCKFTLTEYTVGAVIKEAVGNRIILGMNEREYQNYAKLTDFNEMDVYLKDGMSLDEISATRNEINDYLKKNSGWETEITDSAVYALARRRAMRPANIDAISVLVLLTSPIILLFSQMIYYRNRRKEFAMLKSMGACDKDIRKMHIFAGIVLSVLLFVTNFAVCYLVCQLIYLFFSRVLTSFGFIEFDVVFSRYVSPLRLIICATVSAICGIMSCIIPYIVYRKNNNASEESRILTGE